MSKYEITGCQTVINSNSQAFTARRGDTYRTSAESTTVYEVKPPFTPGSSFLQLVIGTFMGRESYAGHPEFGFLASTDEASYFVYRNHENKDVLTALQDRFSRHFQGVLDRLGEEGPDSPPANLEYLASMAWLGEV